MEPTYFWDGLSGEAIDWLNANTPAGPVGPVRDVPDLMALPQADGPAQGARWPGSTPADRPKWTVLQNRAGGVRINPKPRCAICHEDGPKPAFVVSKLGVPLVLIYPSPRTDQPMPTSRGTIRPRGGRALGPALVAGVRPWCWLIALLATVPTSGDIGLTWDEPSYRTSQLISSQWWEAMAKVRTRADLDALLSSPTPCSITGLTAGSATTSTRPWPVS